MIEDNRDHIEREVKPGSTVVAVMNLTEGVYVVGEVGDDGGVIAGLSLPVLIMAAAGGVVFLLIICVLIVCLSRRK